MQRHYLKSFLSISIICLLTEKCRTRRYFLRCQYTTVGWHWRYFLIKLQKVWERSLHLFYRTTRFSGGLILGQLDQGFQSLETLKTVARVNFFTWKSPKMLKNDTFLLSDIFKWRIIVPHTWLFSQCHVTNCLTLGRVLNISIFLHY